MKKPEFLIGIPDGPIEHIRLDWANMWINIYDNGGIGYQGYRQPTAEEKADIRKRISKQLELLKQKEMQLYSALKLMI